MATIIEDTPTELVLIGADIDTLAGDLTYTIVEVPAHGAIESTGSPRVTYSPDPNFVGDDSFTFTVSDAGFTSAPARVRLTVSGVDDLPVAEPQEVEVDEDESVVFQLSGSDLEESALTFSVVTDPRSGILDANGSSTVTYTPGPDFNGADTFQFIVTADGVDSAPATVTVTVNPVNDPPTSLDGDARTTVDEPVTITLEGEDADGDTLSYVIVDGPASGELGAVEGDQVRFDPLGVAGEVTFTFKADDGEVDSELVGTITVTVTEFADGSDAGGGDADAGGGGRPARGRPDVVSCASASGQAPSSAWPLLAGVFGLIGFRRRR